MTKPTLKIWSDLQRAMPCWPTMIQPTSLMQWKERFGPHKTFEVPPGFLRLMTYESCTWKNHSMLVPLNESDLENDFFFQQTLAPSCPQKDMTAFWQTQELLCLSNCWTGDDSVEGWNPAPVDGHHLQGNIHPKWSKFSAINSIQHSSTSCDTATLAIDRRWNHRQAHHEQSGGRFRHCCKFCLHWTPLKKNEMLQTGNGKETRDSKIL